MLKVKYPIHSFTYYRNGMREALKAIRREFKDNINSGNNAYSAVDTLEAVYARTNRRTMGGALWALAATAKAAPKQGFRISDEVNTYRVNLSGAKQTKFDLRYAQVYICPVCNHRTLRHSGYDHSRTRVEQETPCEHCREAGAFFVADAWFKDEATARLALSPEPVWLLSATDLKSTLMTEIQRRGLTALKTNEGIAVTRDGQSVMYRPGTLQMNYHSGHEIGAYADTDRLNVGIELELNRGTHGTTNERESIMGRILNSTKHAVKIERDGSITAFEIISGYGSPAALREKLSPIFANDLLRGFRTGAQTGAHVHVTNPWAMFNADGDVVTDGAVGEMKLAMNGADSMAFSPFWKMYKDLSARDYNRYAEQKVGSHRYAAVAARGKTVEFRLFRMQLSLAKLMRNAQFAWAMTKGQMDRGEEEAGTPLDITKWLSWLADQPREQTLELRAWLAGEGLKVPHEAKVFRKAYRDLGINAYTV